MVRMTTASVSDLKANLSRYLRDVRRGSEVQVLDRGTPVARLVPAGAQQGSERERLIASGVLRPGQGGASAVLDQRLLELPASVSEALNRDREDRL